MTKLINRLHEGIKFYFDASCKKPVKEIKWDSGFHITMVNGEMEHLPNVALAGQVVTANFYARNETKYKFGVRELLFPDKRVKIEIADSWLLPMSPVKVALSVQISSEPIKKEVVEAAQFVIKGFFVVE